MFEKTLTPSEILPVIMTTCFPLKTHQPNRENRNRQFTFLGNLKKFFFSGLITNAKLLNTSHVSASLVVKKKTNGPVVGKKKRKNG